MIKRRLSSLIVCICLVIAGLSLQMDYCQAEGEIVQMASIYTYAEMGQDLNELVALYPDFVSYEIVGSSVCNQLIPLVRLGNENAPKKVLVTSSIHAREFANTQVVMKMIEYYATCYATGQLQDVYNKTCFYIMPICNPDGVTFVQIGASALVNCGTAPANQATITFLNSQSSKNKNRWKTNANGVDLNRNFDAGFGLKATSYTSPGYKGYAGAVAGSEPETQAVLAACNKYSYDLFINFHMQGQVLYCTSDLASAEVNAQSIAWAGVVNSVNHYKIIASGGSECYGTFADYTSLVYQKPFVTIETGSGLSYTQSAKIFSQNQHLFTIINTYL